MSRPISVLLLAAGLGTRLHPYTINWPKCLMPINGKPLLEYWLETARQLATEKVLVNTHYLADTVQRFLDRPVFKRWVKGVHEPELKGTAGTLRANASDFRDTTVLLVHADNFCQCDFSDFLGFHQTSRPNHCPITMMTFYTQTPSMCGIVELDGDGVAIGFHEKLQNPREIWQTARFTFWSQKYSSGYVTGQRSQISAPRYFRILLGESLPGTMKARILILALSKHFATRRPESHTKLQP